MPVRTAARSVSPLSIAKSCFGMRLASFVSMPDASSAFWVSTGEGTSAA